MKPSLLYISEFIHLMGHIFRELVLEPLDWDLNHPSSASYELFNTCRLAGAAQC